MNQLEDRLSDLLHRCAPPTRPLASEPVLARGRSLRRRRRGVALAAVLAAAGLAGGLVIGLGTDRSKAGRQELITRPTPTPAPSAVPDQARQGGLTYAIPPGWKRQLTAFCGPQPSKTVAGAFTPLMRCLDRTIGPSAPSVRLGPIWTADSSGSWAGRRIDWQGQPAYLDTDVSTGVPGEVVEVMTFPLLNARVTAVGPDVRAVQALLGRVEVSTSPVPIPSDASSIRIVRKNSVPPQSPPVVVTDHASVVRLLDDLRGSTKATSPTCLSAWASSPTVITVQPYNGDPVSYLTSPDACPVLTAGSGGALDASPALIDDVNRYAPANLSLPPDPGVTVPICNTSQLTGSFGGSVSPEAQERSTIVNLRNDGSACQVFGYPFVDVFDDAGQIAVTTENGGGYILDTPGVIVLQPGQSAHVVLAASACGPTFRAVTRAQLTLRGDLTPVIVSSPNGTPTGLPICPGYNGALVQVGPFVAGALQGQ